MKPRQAPKWAAVIQLALDQLNHYGAHQEFIPATVDVAAYWKVVKKRGLPEDEPDLLTVVIGQGAERDEWKIYVVTQSSMRMGFAESPNGETLYLMLLVPVKAMTVRQAVAETSNRL